MNIKCSESDNMIISLNYFNSIKLLSDDLIKFIKGYKQIFQEFTKKLISLQTNFKSKLSKPENPMSSQIIISLTSKISQLMSQNNELFQLSLDEIDLRLKEFDSFIKEKNELIKSIQKSSLDLNKSLINSYTEINKIKVNYLNSLSKAEEIINKYYTDKDKLNQHETGLGDKLNDNDYNLLKEQIKNQVNEMNNAIKLSKKLENNYKEMVSSSVKIHDKYVESHNNFRDKIKKSTCELSEEIKTLIVSFLFSYKNNYKQPLAFVETCINECNIIEEGKLTEKIISKDFQNDNQLKNLSPSNYKLKSIDILKESNYLKNDGELNTNNNKKNNKLQRKRTISKLEDGFEEMEYISDEPLIYTIKSLFDNFTLIDKEDFNIELEEKKNKTQKYILKIIANMNSYPYAKYGKNTEKGKKNINPNTEYKREELETEEIFELRNLLENHQNRIIFLQKLSDYRSRGKFYIDIVDYAMLSNFFNIIAEKVKRDIDYHSAEMVIILSQTYCMEEGTRKKYLQEGIKENCLFKEKSFWEEFLVYSINKEIMKTLKRDQKMKENKRTSESKYSNVVFSQILTLIDNMFEFNVDKNAIKEILEPKINYYKLNDSLKNTINDVIISKEQEKNIEKKKIEEMKKVNNEDNPINSTQKDENIKKEILENKIIDEENLKEKEENKNIKGDEGDGGKINEEN